VRELSSWPTRSQCRSRAAPSPRCRAPDKVFGKPDPSMLTGIMARHGLAPDQIAMVGDRIYTDIAMARRAGALGVLVLTGEATAADAAAAQPPPDLVLGSLAELGEQLRASRA
jgi:NagD protein